MVKSCGYVLTAGLLLCAAAARAQMGFGGGPMMGGPMAQMGPTSPEIEKLQKEQTELMKETDPELVDYQEKMQGVQGQIMKVMKSFADKEIDKDEAHAQLLPLLKEEQELRDDPDFQAEQRLSSAVFSSPEFQKRMAKIQEKVNKAMQKLMAERMSKARRGRPTTSAASAVNARPQSTTAR
ncbi:MAG: hypothetical protein HKL90_13995 [Elusimicrobia bacterium]|nr:hypothetical protein [Elusimicrobiota bacterium]